MQYRREIDGLRAVAVVPVILYHAGLPAFSGGFTGVDIFFVISGYLITGLLVEDIDQGRYSILRFYERRARRILPALLFMILGSLLLAWFIMLPGSFRELSRSVLAVLGFGSNFLFWSQEGYFATSADLKPMLHTWSLAVEEQFYLFFPLVLLVLRRMRRPAMAAIIVAGCVLSFALCVYASRAFPSANFYLLPTRAWELLAGATCVFFVRAGETKGASVLAGLGLALIVYGVVFLSPGVPFPSHYALFPVAGTVLVILFGDARRGAGLLLAHAVPVGIGLISYSLYLWHQPLFAFARLADARPLSTPTMVALIAAAFVLATLSWKFVEQPFRRKERRLPLKLTLGLTAASLAMIGAVATYAEVTDAAVGRLERSRDPLVAGFVVSRTASVPLPSGCKAEGPDLDVAPCWLAGSSASPFKVAVFGDSHALALRTALPEVAAASGAGILFASSPGCPSLPGGYVFNGNGPVGRCPARAQAQLDAAVRAGVSRAYLVVRWQLYTAGDPFQRRDHYLVATTPEPRSSDRASSRAALAALLVRTVVEYRAKGIEVVLVEQVPEQRQAVDRLVERLPFVDLDEPLAGFVVRTSIERPTAERDYRFARAILRQSGASLLDPRPLFAAGNRYLWAGPRETWYGDNSHISLSGARRLAPLLVADLARRSDAVVRAPRAR